MTADICPQGFPRMNRPAPRSSAGCGLFRVVITHRADHGRNRYRPETLTGEVAVQSPGSATTSGFLALQVHSFPSKIQFRNLQVK